MALSYEEMRKMPDAELVALHDRMAGSTTPSLDGYREEIARRETERSNDALLGLTKQLTYLTWAVVVLTVITAGCSIAALLVAA